MTFRLHEPEVFDVVIGAGGLHSLVRRLVFGSEGRFEKYLGYYAASFSVEGYPRKDPHAYVSYAAPGHQVSRYSLRGDRTVFLLVLAADDRLPVGPPELNTQKEILRATFGRDRWECPDILAALDFCSDLYFDSVSQIRMDSWSQGRVALVGESFAGSFAPKTKLGIFIRNQVTRLMSVPFVADWAMGSLLNDPLKLPAYN